jgi:hypothetical protein
LGDDGLDAGCASDPTNIVANIPIQRIISPRLFNGAYPLVAGSPAIDAVNDGTGCSPTDQRGVPRPQDGNSDGGPACDTAAYEYVSTGATQAPAAHTSPLTQSQAPQPPPAQPQPPGHQHRHRQHLHHQIRRSQNLCHQRQCHQSR